MKVFLFCGRFDTKFEDIFVLINIWRVSNVNLLFFCKNSNCAPKKCHLIKIKIFSLPENVTENTKDQEVVMIFFWSCKINEGQLSLRNAV